MLDANPILIACQRILGPLAVVSDLSWPLGDNQVLELSDRHGRSWIAKVVRHNGTYQRELHALRHWAPGLDDGAPALRGADDALRLLVMTKLPGRLAEDSVATDAAVHGQAGRLTRRLHDAEPPVLDAAIAAATAGRLERWIAEGSGLLSDDDIRFARQMVSPLAALGPVPVVPCHLDNQPRNWMVDDTRTVRFIDFGMCRRDVWIRDLGRLSVQQWVGRPDLRDAFYAGYGRTPAASDLVLLRCYVAYGALSSIVWARQHGDPAFENQGRQTLRLLRAGALQLG